ncbi:MAG: LLM class flavin-dependent oxidoreductase, partial [Spirillospora sp.]
MSRWGLTIPLTGLPLAEHREIIADLAGLGYTDAWSAEVSGADAFTPLALASQWGPDLRLGPAIAPVYTRGPALLAQHAATLADLAPGRFVLGIGSSSDTIVERWNGLRFDEPYKRTRDTLRFLRRALAGEKVKEEYDTFAVRGFKLEMPPAVPPPIVLAALRPGMLRLAAREADGAISNWLAPADVRT